MDFEGFKLNWILEIGSISVIAWAAWMQLRSRPKALPPGPNFIWVTAPGESRKSG
jgi:hypothetical protein